MIVSSRTAGNAVVYGALLFSVCLGIYNGLYPCPHYLWEGWVEVIILLGLAMVPLLFASHILRVWWLRVLFPLGIVGLTVICGYLSAPFYPSAPSTLTEYIHSVNETWKYGPCG